MHPRQSKCQFLGHFLLRGEDSELQLVVLKDLTKKGCQLFSAKSAPPDKILATPMGGVAAAHYGGVGTPRQPCSQQCSDVISPS